MNIYQARILSAGLNIPEKLFQLWTTLMTMEVFQESYAPEVVKEKEHALKLIQDNVTHRQAAEVRMFKKLHQLTARESDMRPATPREKEEFKRKLRKRHMRAAQGH